MSEIEPGERVRVPVEQLAAKLGDVRKNRKAKVRHDAPPAPIDGDYDPLTLTNKDPGYEYYWASDKDRARLAHRGWTEATWGPNEARPAYYYGTDTRGSAIRYQELTLMKLPTEHAQLAREHDPARRRHLARMRELMNPPLPNHRFTLTEQTLTGS